MQRIEPLILEAWERIKSQILSNPDELARRRARMKGRTLSRPPRAWCLAVKASDKRTNVNHRAQTAGIARFHAVMFRFVPGCSRRARGDEPQAAQVYAGARIFGAGHDVRRRNARDRPPGPNGIKLRTNCPKSPLLHQRSRA